MISAAFASRESRSLFYYTVVVGALFYASHWIDFLRISNLSPLCGCRSLFDRPSPRFLDIPSSAVSTTDVVDCYFRRAMFMIPSWSMIPTLHSTNTTRAHLTIPNA